jgi:hypothetical protein
LLLFQSQQEAETARGAPDPDPDGTEQREREERCRVATLSAVFAAREITIPVTVDLDEA